MPGQPPLFCDAHDAHDAPPRHPRPPCPTLDFERRAQPRELLPRQPAGDPAQLSNLG